MPKSDEWQDFLSHHNKFDIRSLIRKNISFEGYIYICITKGQFCYSEKLHSTITSAEALFSNHREADQKIRNRALFAISPESSVCVCVCVSVCVG